MRGLLMVEPLYHQTVAGNKTQTRRSGGLEMVNNCLDENYQPTDWVIEKTSAGKEIKVLEFMRPDNRSTVIQSMPRYHVAEVLYLKEPWAFLQSDTTDFWNGYAYKFGAPSGCAISETGCQLGGTEIKFKNKLFMPSKAARAYVKITGVKCERLLDISDDDCIAEGIQTFPSPGGINDLIYKQYGKFDGPAFCLTPKNSFISLFKFANKVKTVPNIWVWAYSFEYLKNYKA